MVTTFMVATAIVYIAALYNTYKVVKTVKKIKSAK